MPFDFNVDVKLTDENDSSNVQFINMTIASAPQGALSLQGNWQGQGGVLMSSGGEFWWDNKPGQQVAFVYDGPQANTRLVVGLQDFVGPNGDLPPRGATGGGATLDPNNPSFTGTIIWLIT